LRRFTVIAALVAALALGACGGEDEAPFVPERVTNEQALHSFAPVMSPASSRPTAERCA